MRVQDTSILSIIRHKYFLLVPLPALSKDKYSADLSTAGLAGAWAKAARLAPRMSAAQA
jgi:hypothetical protein